MVSRCLLLVILALAVGEHQVFSMAASQQKNKKKKEDGVSTIVPRSKLEKRNNRLSARRYRERKAQAFRAVQEENAALKDEVAALKDEIAASKQSDSLSPQEFDVERLYLQALIENSQLSKKNSTCLEEIQRLRDEVRRLSELAL